MRHAFAVFFALSFFSLAGAGEVTLNDHGFTIPDGFEIELIAKRPLVDRPITADLDEKGRLYVADSSGSNDNVQEQLKQKPHRIMRLVDTDGDGVFDRSTVFAEQMMFPEGTMWYAGSLYVAAPPSIWKLTDTDDDGVADQRVEWFQGKTLTGCANDLHGPYLGPDGWIYWCKGAFAEQTYMIAGKPWTSKAAHIFRCRPDGTEIEPVMTGGMDNPVDVVFLPNGERVFSTTFFVMPGNGQRDGLIHAIYGGVYGKQNGATDGHARTGELMPVLSHMGAAAPCGLVRYESDLFGADFRDNLFTCQFNMHKVSRHVLTPKGASYDSKDSDFVTSNNTDFHPTDVLADPDGSLIVVDTGGWYKLCCPSSQLHKPDILGAIYRVKRKDAARVDDSRGDKIAWEKLRTPALIGLMGDQRRPAVRWRATAEIERRWKNEETRRVDLEELKAVESKSGRFPWASAWQHVLWSMSRVDSPESRTVIRRFIELEGEQNSDAVHLSCLLAGFLRDRDAIRPLLKILRSGSPANRRAAAEALGRIGDKLAVPYLLAVADVANDRILEHSLVFALITLADPAATSEGLVSKSPRVQRAALIALDQMPGGKLKVAQVLARIDSSEPILKEAANWVAARHPEWGGDLAGWLSEQLAQIDGSHKGDDLRSLLIRYAGHPAIRDLLAGSVTRSLLPMEARELGLRVMAQARPSEMPVEWADALTLLVSDGPPALLDAAVAAARDIPPAKQPHESLNVALVKLADTREAPATARLHAMSAVAGGMPRLSTEQFAMLLASLHPDQAVANRSAAADALAKARLTPQQFEDLAQAMRSVGPLELNRLLAAFERSTDEALGLALIDSLKAAQARSSLRIDLLQQMMAKYGPTVLQGVADVVALVNVGAAAQKKQIEDLLPTLATGDVRRGQAVFNNTKAACTACHRFGYLGGNAGPDLTRIGGIRTERDLLESILFPSLSFVRSYEPVVVVTTNGRIINGLIRNETAGEILLAIGPNQEVRLARSDIEEINPSTISIMPAGLDKQLTPQELADLVAFLKNAK